MFDFRIITCTDGTQVIDPSLKTPYSALTPVQMAEYMEMDVIMHICNCLCCKALRRPPSVHPSSKHPLLLSRNLSRHKYPAG